MPTVSVPPSVLGREAVPHVCAVTGEPTDEIRRRRAFREGSWYYLSFLVGALPILAAAWGGGVDAYLPISPAVRRRQLRAVAAVVVSPVAVFVSPGLGLSDAVVGVIGLLAVAAMATGIVVAWRSSPGVLTYESGLVTIPRAHPAFATALAHMLLPPPTVGDLRQ
jgi:hypothetical protein